MRPDYTVSEEVIDGPAYDHTLARICQECRPSEGKIRLPQVVRTMSRGGQLICSVSLTGEASLSFDDKKAIRGLPKPLSMDNQALQLGETVVPDEVVLGSCGVTITHDEEGGNAPPPEILRPRIQKMTELTSREVVREDELRRFVEAAASDGLMFTRNLLVLRCRRASLHRASVSVMLLFDNNPLGDETNWEVSKLPDTSAFMGIISEQLENVYLLANAQPAGQRYSLSAEEVPTVQRMFNDVTRRRFEADPRYGLRIIHHPFGLELP